MANKNLTEIVKYSISSGIVFHLVYSGLTTIRNSEPFLNNLSDRNTIGYSFAFAALIGFYKIYKKFTD